jgi:hypothetical protein
MFRLIEGTGYGFRQGPLQNVPTDPAFPFPIPHTPANQLFGILHLLSDHKFHCRKKCVLFIKTYFAIAPPVG